MARKRRNLKPWLFILFVLAALIVYSYWFIDDELVSFVILFSFISYSLVFLMVLLGLLISAWLLHWLLPKQLGRLYKTGRIRFHLALLAAGGFALYAGLTLNQDWLPHRFHPVSLLADIMILGLAVFIGWAFLKPSLKKLFVQLPALGLALVVLIWGYTILSGGSTRANRASLEELESLAYLTWVPSGDSTAASSKLSGVTYHAADKASPGINIYCSRNLPSAYLIAMDGTVLHEWSAKLAEDDTWHHVEMGPNGDLFVQVKEKTFLRIGWDSTVKWSGPMRVHHDVALADNGDIYTMLRHDAVVRVGDLPVPIIDETIAIFSPDYTIKKEIRLFDLFKDDLPADIVWRSYRWLLNPVNLAAVIDGSRNESYALRARTPSDVFHSNTLEIIDRDIDDVFRKGNLLVCIRNLDLVGVIDGDTDELVWSWGAGVLERPHHPTLLANGNILVFDNGTIRRYSRVLEFDPTSNRIVWAYEAEPRESFFSLSRGGSQRLPNGNTLITNSDNGHAFEVTRDGEVVWEFYNPEIRVEDNHRAAIYRLMRITNPEDYPCLQGLY